MTTTTTPARTYGRFQHAPTYSLGRGTRTKAAWLLHAEPAVAMRLKRTFGRAVTDRGGVITLTHTREVARDLEWFMDRYPLEPVDEESATALRAAADEHRALEQAVHEIKVGTRRPHLPRPLTKEPRDYQLAVVEQLRTVNGLLLTDELGLGKTLSAVASLVYEDALPAVVVPPTHLPPRWLDELQESAPWLRAVVAKKGTPYPLADKKTGQEPDVIILPYSRMAGWVDHLLENVGVKTVIFDEVQELRHGTHTVKGVAAGQLADGCTYRLGLSATPVMNYGSEVWNILQVIAPSVLGSRDEFLREWGGKQLANNRVIVHDPAVLGDYLREQGVMLGRTREQVGRELPATIKVTQDVPWDASHIEKVAGDAAGMAQMLLDGSGTREDRFTASGRIEMMMRHATGVAKAPFVAEYVRMLMQSEEKIVLFGWHRDVYDIWLQRLAEFRPALYTGTETPTQKQAALERFKTDPTCRILVMSLRSGAGVDGLQKVARTAVFGELDWSPQVHEQAIGRLRRDGQDGAPAAYFLLADAGSDPAVAGVLALKRQQGEQLVSPDGLLFNNSVADVDRTRMLAEQIVAASGRRK